MSSDSRHAAPSPKDIRILIIDSDPPSRRLMQAVLEQEGCELRSASSGREALALVGEYRPTLVLLELVLPDVSGIELVRRLKSDALTRNAVIVAVTALNGPETQRAALEAGCADYIRKPIDALSFAARLLSHLGRHVESAKSTAEGGSET